MPFQIVQGDLTTFKADAVVNAANRELRQGGGVCGALFQAAGVKRMQRACDALHPINPGEAVFTPGFNLKAKYVIHAVGPVFLDGHHNEEALLKSAYTSSLKIAEDLELKSVAFPLISSGAYGYPHQQAIHVAINAIREFLNGQEGEELDVYLVLYDRGNYRPDVRLARRLYALERELRRDVRYSLRDTADQMVLNRDLPVGAPEQSLGQETDEIAADDEQEKVAYSLPSRRRFEISRTTPLNLAARIGQKDEGFSAMLLHLIDEKGLKDAQVYKRANIDRKHFSKIRSNPNYTPGKQTVFALAIALELSKTETEKLLAQAGYAFSPSSMTDIIILYFLENGDYRIDLINETLFQYDQALLGGLNAS